MLKNFKFVDLDMFSEENIKKNEKVLKNIFLIDMKEINYKFREDRKFDEINYGVGEEEMLSILSYKKTKKYESILKIIHQVCIDIIEDYDINIKEFFNKENIDIFSHIEKELNDYLYLNIKETICIISENNKLKETITYKDSIMKYRKFLGEVIPINDDYEEREEIKQKTKENIIRNKLKKLKQNSNYNIDYIFNKNNTTKRKKDIYDCKSNV